MVQADIKQANQAAQSSSILFVDDEINILSSLKRLFRNEGYSTLFANSGLEALEMLTQNKIDIVVSDMRMPEMDGAQLLEQVKNKWPETVRILLTGYSDMNATIDAVNKGGIYCYISKPWKDKDILVTIKNALEIKKIKEERDQLLLLTRKQNQKLQSMNEQLDTKVKLRTSELNQTMSQLEITHESLKKQYSATIKIFTGLIESRLGAVSGHYRRAAELARDLAKEVGINSSQLQDVIFAALLMDIGKIGLPDHLLSIPYEKVEAMDRPKYENSPILGEAALMGLEPLQGAAKLIRFTCENYNGTGYPGRLKGKDIPLGARVIALANDYESLIDGSLLNKRLTVSEAKLYINRQRGKRYDPVIVDVLFPRLSNDNIKNSKDECYFTTPKQLKPGMIVGRDFVLDNGMVFFTNNQVLNESMIKKIQELEASMDARFRVFIKNVG